MIHFLSPYSQEKNLGRAYNESVSLITNSEDWICLIDLDVMVLSHGIGHHLQEIINLHPNTGLFSCRTNRVGQKRQCLNGVISDDPNLLNHRKIALQLAQEKRLIVSPLENPISGHLMLFKKSTWESVGGFPENRGILSVDNTFSNRIVRKGYNILMMEGVYVCHFYRLDTGILNKDHLL
jgi:GT2 family glycosyltransferase